MTRKEKAMKLFEAGYNCSQSVALAFSDMIDMDESALAMMASPFGAGMGRLREVCGCVSGMFMVIGLLYGNDNPSDNTRKKEIYEKVQKLAASFEKKNGSIVCRELLGLEHKKDQPQPEERTKEYYKKRPCKELVGDAAQIVEAFLETIEK